MLNAQADWIDYCWMPLWTNPPSPVTNDVRRSECVVFAATSLAALSSAAGVLGLGW